MDPRCAGPGGPRAGDGHRAQSGPPDPAGRRGALAAPALVDGKEGPRVRPKRARVIDLSTHPPAGVTVVCADELGPVVPRTFPPAPGWSADGHRVKAPLEDGRGSEQDLGVRRAAGGG